MCTITGKTTWLHGRSSGLQRSLSNMIFSNIHSYLTQNFTKLSLLFSVNLKRNNIKKNIILSIVWNLITYFKHISNFLDICQLRPFLQLHTDPQTQTFSLAPPCFIAPPVFLAPTCSLASLFPLAPPCFLLWVQKETNYSLTSAGKIKLQIIKDKSGSQRLSNVMN